MTASAPTITPSSRRYKKPATPAPPKFTWKPITATPTTASRCKPPCSTGSKLCCTHKIEPAKQLQGKHQPGTEDCHPEAAESGRRISAVSSTSNQSAERKITVRCRTKNQPAQ